MRDGKKSEYPTCIDCHINIQSQINCDHSKTQTLTNLEPVSYNFKWVNITHNYLLIWYFRIIDNSGDERKVWFNKTYSSSSSDDISPVRDFYQTVNEMQDEIYEGVTPCEEMELSESEQEEFDRAKNCYVCTEKMV